MPKLRRNNPDDFLSKVPPDSEIATSQIAEPEAEIEKPLPKSKDVENYKKQQFYCERDLLQWVVGLKARAGHGDLSDVINQAIREYKARMEVD